jgi:hypothetical protein
MELRVLERISEKKLPEEAYRTRSEEVERFVRPPLVLVASFFVAGFFYFVVDLVTVGDLYGLMEHPLFIVLWTAVTSWLMWKR